VPSPSLTIEQVLVLLAESPPRIGSLTTDLTPAQLGTKADEDDWSVSDVLAHLRACGDVWGGNIQKILAEEEPAFRRISPRTWIRKTDYLDMAFVPSFAAYSTQRDELISVLRPLSPEGWSRNATVNEAAGKIYGRSVFDYAEQLARHEREHVQQIEQIVSLIRA
jgi:hypothetical protein